MESDRERERELNLGPGGERVGCGRLRRRPRWTELCSSCLLHGMFSCYCREAMQVLHRFWTCRPAEWSKTDLRHTVKTGKTVKTVKTDLRSNQTCGTLLEQKRLAAGKTDLRHTCGVLHLLLLMYARSYCIPTLNFIHPSPPRHP